MFTSKRFNRIVREVPNEGAAGGAAPADQAPPGTENNNDANAFSWQSTDTGDPAAQANSTPAAVPAADPAAAAVPGQQIQEHLAGLNLVPVAEFQAAMTQFGEDGNSESLQAVMTSVANNAYLQAVQTTNTVMNGRIAEAVKEAVSQAGSQAGFKSTMDQLTSELPMMANPNMQPIAQAALQAAVQQGSTPEQAVAKVKSLMKEAFDGGQEHFASPSNTPGGAGFNGQADPEAENWADIFGPKKPN